MWNSVSEVIAEELKNKNIPHPRVHLPLFTFMIDRASRESVQGRPKTREAPFLLCFNYIILQRHKFIKKQEFC